MSKQSASKKSLKKLSMPDFNEFCQDIKKFYTNTKSIKKGEAKSGNKNHYAVSVYSIDGQKLQLGDHEEKFELQSAMKPILYAIALHDRGEEKIHKHIGREPSGKSYDTITLNQDNLPHNPMVNAGALMACSLVMPEKTVEKRFEHIKREWSRICANTSIGFNEESFKSSAKSQATMRNMALCYHMQDQGAFPENTNIQDTMELYRRCCSMEVSVDQLAMASATLANGGICPLTGDKVFASDNVRDCLSIMLSCGMYNHSGEFAFMIGLPAKSGVAGAMMVVVPGLMGISIYSPPIDHLGNPVRGIEFCKELVKTYSFHMYDHIVDPSHER